MNVLSLFDGMACGALALFASNIEIERYVAYEIDKYAIKTSIHNFPFIEHRGDVFTGDFTEYKDFDLLCGGSPCTYWSIAQQNNRETEASGMGWELFQQYVRALREAEPKFFIYENNKSMSNAIRASITEAFGFEPILINSALVSAQNRQRLYWVGRRNADGTYSKVDVEQPKDKGIVLSVILESGSPQNTTLDGKSQTLKAQYQNTNQQNVCCYKSTYGASGVAEPVRVGCMPSPDGEIKNSQAMRIYSCGGKSVNLTAQGGGLGAKTGLYAVPCGTRQPEKSRTLTSSYSRGGQRDFKMNIETNGQLGKTGVIDCFAKPIEWNEHGEPTKATSGIDGKTYTVYRVENNWITIKNKQYPIKIMDGYYIIRKLTVRECMRLQTVPEWYEFPVSDSQAYKMLGNGWTVDVIAHILNSIFTRGGNDE